MDLPAICLAEPDGRDLGRDLVAAHPEGRAAQIVRVSLTDSGPGARLLSLSWEQQPGFLLGSVKVPGGSWGIVSLIGLRPVNQVDTPLRPGASIEEIGILSRGKH